MSLKRKLAKCESVVTVRVNLGNSSSRKLSFSHILYKTREPGSVLDCTVLLIIPCEKSPVAQNSPRSILKFLLNPGGKVDTLGEMK